MVRSNAALSMYIAQTQVLENLWFKNKYPSATQAERQKWAKKVKWFTFRPTINGGFWNALFLAPRYKIASYYNLARSPFELISGIASYAGIGGKSETSQAILSRYLMPFALMAGAYILALGLMGYDLEKDWTDKDFLKLTKYVDGSKGKYDEKDPLFVMGTAIRMFLKLFHAATYSNKNILPLPEGYSSKLSDRFGNPMGESSNWQDIFGETLASWLSPSMSFIPEMANQADYFGTRFFETANLEHPYLDAYLMDLMKRLSPLTLQSVIPNTSPLDLKQGSMNRALQIGEEFGNTVLSEQLFNYGVNLGANFFGAKSQFDYKPYLDPEIKDAVRESGIKLDPNSDKKDPNYPYFKEENNNPFRDLLKVRVAMKINIWFNEEMNGNIDEIMQRTKEKPSLLQQKYKEISAQERDWIVDFAISQVGKEKFEKFVASFQK